MRVLGPPRYRESRMTRSSIFTPRAVARRLTAVAVVVGAGLLTIAIEPDDTAGAARRTNSSTIAAAADRALSALDRWTQHQDPVDYVRFVRGRERTATLTARDLELDAAQLRTVWAEASAEKVEAVLAAMTQLGVPYESIASEPGVGFDCSGLTSWAYRQAGAELPRVSGDQIRAAEQVDREAAEPGDLVHYPGHVGIYLGGDAYVHSPEPGSTVEAVHLPSRSLRFGDAFDGSDDAGASS